MSTARAHTPETGARVQASDHVSKSHDYSDEGYALSVEAAIMAHVDHDLNRKWMEEATTKSVKTNDGKLRL